MVQVDVKWSGTNYRLNVDPEHTGATLKAQLWSVTQVPPERQKIMGLKGGLLKDDVILGETGLREGARLMMIGTADSHLPTPTPEPTIFVEDLTPAQRVALLKEKNIAAPPVGLVNLGATCYLNAVLQFLSPVDAFREMVKSLPGTVTSQDQDLCVCAAFRTLEKQREASDIPIPPLLAFGALRSRFPQFAQQRRSNGTDPGGYMQQDAEECLSLLLDCFNRNSVDNQVDKIFGFTLEKQLRCLDDPSEPPVRSEETCRILPCHFGTQQHAVDHLHQGVRLFLDETMTKFSETLQRDAQYTKSLKMNSLPPNLVVHFVRFEWKRAGSLARNAPGRAKICRRLTFPLDLDIFDFASESLRKKLAIGRQILHHRAEFRGESTPSKRLKASTPSSNAAETPAAQAPASTSTSTLSESSCACPAVPSLTTATTAEADKISVPAGHYSLQSIITHQGRSPESGHYVSWVRRDEDTWWKVDDDKVTQCTWSSMNVFGGCSDYHIAVLLLYREERLEATAFEVEQAEKALKQAESSSTDNKNESHGAKAINPAESGTTDEKNESPTKSSKQSI